MQNVKCKGRVRININAAAHFVIINKLLKNSSETSKNPAAANSPTIKRRAANALFTIANALALFAAIWIVFPAPSYYVWLWSVAASEWSFALGAFALFAILCATVFGRGKLKIVSIIFGAIALAISLYPFFSALSAARENTVALSLQEYVFGFRGGKDESPRNTFTFAVVDGKPLELDVYAPPENIVKNGAGIVVVHGGAWKAGERGDFPQWNDWLARQGYTLFDVDYRLAPQPNYLTATGDVKCAVGWVKKNAARFAISPDKIALLGRSAGAHLALLAAYSAGDARLPSSCADNKNDLQANEKVRAVVSFYAPTDLLWAFDNPANDSVLDGKKTLADFLGGSPHDSENERDKFLFASPTARVSTDTPPTLLIHGGQDQLVRLENAALLAEKLKQESVSHKIIFLSYAQHGFDYNFNGWGAQVVRPVLLDFLRENVAADK